MNFLQKAISRLIPTVTKILRIDTRQEPSAIAHTMDVDKLASILRSAEGGDMEDYFSLCRDVIAGHGHAQSQFGTRKLAVIGDKPVISAEDKDVAEDVAIAKLIKEQTENLDELLDVYLHLLDSTLYPVALVEKLYRPSAKPGWRYELAELRAVPHRLLDWTSGELMIWDVDCQGNKLGTRHKPDPIRYIVHRGHAFTNLPDTWGGPMRAVLFWWLFSVMDRHWWARFLDRYGAPFMVAKYDESDDAARYTLSNAFAAAAKVFGIAVPKHVDIEMVQAQTSSAGDAFKAFHEVANNEISKIIVGQTASSSGTPGKLGNDEAQDNVRQDIRQFDALRLAHTLRTQLFLPLCRLNGWTGKPPLIAWGSESPADLEAIGKLLPGLEAAGIELTDDGIDTLSQRSGLGLQRAPKPVIPPPLAGPADPEDDLELEEEEPDPARPPGRGKPLAAGLPALRRPTAAERRSDRARASNDAIARAGAEDFAEAMRVSMSPIAKILAASDSLDDFERRLKARFPALPSRKAAAVMEAALIANATNAILNFPEPTAKP